MQSRKYLSINSSMIKLAAFGRCGKCVPFTSVEPCERCRLSFKYEEEALAQPHYSIVVLPPKIFDYVFDSGAVPVTYSSIVVGYYAIIEHLNFLLNPENESGLAKEWIEEYHDVREVAWASWKSYHDTKEFKEEASFEMDHKNKRKTNRLSFVRHLEKRIIKGLIALDEAQNPTNGERRRVFETWISTELIEWKWKNRCAADGVDNVRRLNKKWNEFFQSQNRKQRQERKN